MSTTPAPSGNDSQAVAPAPQLRAEAYWLHEAAKQHAASEVLLSEHLTATDILVQRALWEGACALIARARELENEALKGGALLHVSVPAAAQAAKVIDEARWSSIRAKVCA